MNGPLVGIRVVEMAGLGPAPFVAMLLSDLGADVQRVERPGAPGEPRDILNRGRGVVVMDLKVEAELAALREIIGGSDVLIEGFRPGVMERLGLCPDVLLEICPRLVYTRVTGQAPEEWQRVSSRLETIFRGRGRDEWDRLFRGTDACVTPVLDVKEAARDQHLRARGTFIELDDLLQPAPAPRFSRMSADRPAAEVHPFKNRGVRT